MEDFVNKMKRRTNLMKTNLLGFFLLFCCTCLSAQERLDSKWKIGALVSLDQNLTQYALSDWVLQGIDDIKNLDANAGVGFSAGLALEYQLNRTTSVRFAPVLSFQKNNLLFVDSDDQTLSIAIHPKTLGIPFHFIYAPRGRAKIPYFFIGPRIQTQIGERFDPMIFSIANTNLSAEFGIGLTIQTKLLSFSPQLSFSQGLSNLKTVGESGLYNNAVRSIKSDRLSLAVIIGLAK